MGEEEKFVGRGTETRTFLYFKVSVAALREFVPDGWQICPVGYGPATGGESVSLQLRFLRGPVSVEQVESRVYSRVWPWFSRIYRVEQAVDVVHPTGELAGLDPGGQQEELLAWTKLFTAKGVDSNCGPIKSKQRF